MAAIDAGAIEPPIPSGTVDSPGSICKLGGFLAGLGFMLPGFILMLGLLILYVEANLAGHLHGLFYGLTAAVGALVARALVRPAGRGGSKRRSPRQPAG